ncbi:cation transport ATPase [Gemmobacter fulvus]|uniref:Cation transport ATPase n=1 Tax=Gemmobacter fulvus TaxID=2840474 RepID=A0A975S2P0_9RHOB|nr:cation transport ATPase [Gemmobacter fulvus]MBT9244763.1 cation transport ATPase [Gemmobacter fulvus]QWK91611.1 cation transport ATPase [Gemmobacter fulvus]
MSIWTSKGGAAALLCCAVLSGCVVPPGGGANSGAQPGRQAVLGGAVTLAAPPGYCIEPASRLEREDTAILLMGRCDGAADRAPAVLTGTVGAAGSGAGVDIAGGGPELAAFFRSERGRAALSRRGRARDVVLHEALGINGAFLLRLTDTGPGKGTLVQAQSWRAVLPLGGRLVSLTVAGTAAAPLDRATGRKLIEAFVVATRAANRGTTAKSTATP